MRLCRGRATGSQLPRYHISKRAGGDRTIYEGVAYVDVSLRLVMRVTGYGSEAGPVKGLLKDWLAKGASGKIAERKMRT